MKNALKDTPPGTTVVPVKRDAVHAPGDEIDLLGYAASLWRYRYVLVIVAVVVGGITYAINRSITPTYETRFRLMGSESGLEDTPGTRLNIVAFRALVESPTQAAGLLEEFHLQGPPHNLSVEKFLRGHVDVDVIRDSGIIAVAVRLKDRDLVVKLAHRYAERVLEAAQRLSTEGIDFTAEQIKRQRDGALERLTLTEEALETYQRRTQIELLRKDVDTMLQRRPDALDLTVRIQGARARLQQSEAALARQEKVRDVRRGVDSVEPSSPPREDVRKRGDVREREDVRIRGELLDPYVNPVYEAIARDVSTYRSQLAGLEQERKALVGRLQLDSPTADKLSRLYRSEAELAILTRNRDVAREVYLNASSKYEGARLQSTIRSPRLQILDAALPPDVPVAPRSLRNTLAAMLIALTLAAITVLVFDASRGRTPARD